MELSRAANTVPERQPEVWERVPPRNRNFTGRDDLLRSLRQNMNTVTAIVPQPQALQGWGGAGKTHLAIEYAYRYRSHYDLVWWIPADQRVLVPSALAAMAPYLGLPPASATGVEEAAESVRRALQNGDPYRRWLLVFDNAEEPGQVEEFIPRGPGHVLITSRNPRWEDHFDTLRVDVFIRDESIAFLNKRLRRDVPTADAFRLAEQLGDLPLALEQAGALQYETGMSIDEYLEQLEEQTSLLLGVNRASGYPLSMTAAWKVSVSLLEDRLPEAVTLLRTCAFFGPEPIPRDVFRRGGKAAAASPLGKILSDPILLARALSELGRFALARIESTNRTIQVHRLIQALLRDDLAEEEKRRTRHEVHLLLAGSAPKDPDNTDKWRSFEELVAHVIPSGLDGCSDPSVRRFALDVIRYLYTSGNYQSALSFLKGFIDRWTAADGAKHPDVLIAHRHLGNVLRGLGRYTEAYETDRVTVGNMGAILGENNSETLRVANGYGASLRARGDFAAARELDEKSRTAHEEHLGPTSPATLRLLNSLALDYALTSEYEAARRLHQETYTESSDAVEGVSKSFLLQAWNGLARAVRLCGDYTEACDLGEDAYAYGVKELTPDHPYTLLAAKDLSIAKRRAGETAEGLDLARDTHTRLQRLFGDEHPDTMAAAINLSNALRTAGDLDEAFVTADRTIALYPRVFGDRHPYSLACRGNLAILHRLRGEVTIARDLNREAVKELIVKVGPKHHYPLSCAIGLQADLSALGEHAEACRIGGETLTGLRDLFGEDHFLTMACAANLSLDLKAAGADEEAGLLRANTMYRYERPLRSGHPDAVMASRGQRIECDFDPPPI
ncbi:FxSxx-COOH system tetratricopeptide repeat protein [Streptosporangium sp. DT93]|uniref:FxSxx-COOH system tetratricopeptide repeat protein n=1 Tax=Streptosporangium sp. DT93 TaxID=3393428 RepID=UPI003CF0A139